MRFKVLLGGGLIVALLLVGCGGGGDDGSGATSSGGTAASPSSDGGGENGDGGSKPLSKRGFITQGDVICGEIPPEYERLRQKTIKEAPKNATNEEINLKAAVPPIFTAVERFEGLTPPKGHEAEVEAIIDALEAAGKGFEKEPSAPLTGPQSPYAEFQKLTKEYGFKFCAEL